MKKIITLFLFLSIAVSAVHSQSLIPLPNDSMEISATVTDGFQPYDIHIGVRNNTANSVSVVWGMSSYTAPAPWGVQLCDNNNCYDLLISAGPYTSSPIAPGDTLDMKFQYSSQCAAGTGSTNVFAYIFHDSVNSVVHLNYKANLLSACTNGIADYSANGNLKLYPNPVQHSFVVSGLENAGDLSFEVYDIKGAAVKSKILNASNTQIEVSVENLPKGEYILKAFDSRGKTVGTSRLTKTD